MTLNFTLDHTKHFLLIAENQMGCVSGTKREEEEDETRRGGKRKLQAFSHQSYSVCIFSTLEKKKMVAVHILPKGPSQSL